MAITHPTRGGVDDAGRVGNADAQLRVFAATGRLVDATPIPVRVPRTPVLLVAAATGALVVLSAGVDAATSVDEGIRTWILAAVAAAGAGLSCRVALAAVLRRHRPTVVEPRPGTLVDTRRIVVGHWLRHDGAWVRVVDTSPGAGPAVDVLVSSGEVLTLDHPVVVAAAPFGPTGEPDPPIVEGP